MSFPIYATSPLPYATAGVLLLAGFWRWLPTWARGAGVATEVLLVGMMTPVGAGVMEAWARSRAPPASACTAPIPKTIVVLGGGFQRIPRSPDDYGALKDAGLQRVFAAVALWYATPGAHLVVSGGAGSRQIPEALPMANLAVHLGVPSAAIEVEDRSRNTWENARNVAALSPKVARRIWLVTSPMSLPRALVAFRAWGFVPCAWSAGPAKTHIQTAPADFIPQGRATRTSAIALHELVGSVEYAVLAWWHARKARRAAAS